MKIRPERTKLFHADGQIGRQTDMTKLTVAFAILRMRLNILHSAHRVYFCFCVDLRGKSGFGLLLIRWLVFYKRDEEEFYVNWTVHHCDSWRIRDQLDVTCYFYFTSYVLNMFRTLIYPSSGAWDYSVELPHWSYCSWFDVCWCFGVVGLEWYSCCRLKPATRIPSSWWWKY